MWGLEEGSKSDGYMRTALLLAAMTGLFLAVSFLIGGQQGMVIAFVIACAMNVFAYWNADKLVLRMSRAEPVNDHRAANSIAWSASFHAAPPADAQDLYDREWTAERVRDRPQSAERCCRRHHRPPEMLNRDEIAGVMAHELAHVKNRDLSP